MAWLLTKTYLTLRRENGPLDAKPENYPTRQDQVGDEPWKADDRFPLSSLASVWYNYTGHLFIRFVEGAPGEYDLTLQLNGMVVPIVEGVIDLGLIKGVFALTLMNICYKGSPHSSISSISQSFLMGVEI